MSISLVETGTMITMDCSFATICFFAETGSVVTPIDSFRLNAIYSLSRHTDCPTSNLKSHQTPYGAKVSQVTSKRSDIIERGPQNSFLYFFTTCSCAICYEKCFLKDLTTFFMQRNIFA